MPNNRLDAIVTDLVAASRSVLRDHDVTFAEYRQAVRYLNELAQAKELPLLIDVFFNASIVDIINKNSHELASRSDMEGPYFLEGAPEVDGRIKTMEAYDGEPLVLRGQVRDTQGKELQGVTVDIWSSTPDGRYSGIHDDIPIEYYRGKMYTDENGRYEVETTVPVPYRIPDKGPTGGLLAAMGRHTWRPAHVHYKLRGEGLRELITQAYFEGGDYVDDDCCTGIVPEQHVIPERAEDGKRIIELDFVLEPVEQQAHAAA